MARNLQSELKKRNAFQSPEEEATLNILRTGGLLLGSVSQVFKQAGLTNPQYNVLRILRGAGEPGLPCQEVAARMVTREPDVTRLIDRLEQAGWVQRARSSTDRRVVRVAITEPGRELVASLDEPVLEAHRANLGHLTRAELAEISRLMVKARQRVPSERD